MDAAVLTDQTQGKLKTLSAHLEAMGQVVVAFSGGVDSTFLLRVAVDALDSEVVAVTAVSASLPPWELDAARTLAHEIGVELVEVRTFELEHPDYRANEGERCFFCKEALFAAAEKVAKERGINTICYGAITDDLGDHRPGMRSARERGVLAPMIDAGLSKAEIRTLSSALGLPTSDKPATPCLSSRFPNGTPIDEEKLARITMCEGAIRALGLVEFRARYHDKLVRIELGPAEEERVYASPALRESILFAGRQAGFDFVSLDLAGYRRGSGNLQLVQIQPSKSGDDLK